MVESNIKFTIYFTLSTFLNCEQLLNVTKINVNRVL